MNSRTSLLIVAVFAAASTGCSMIDASQNAIVSSAKMFRPNPFDGPVEQDSLDDEWGFVGNEGRADQARESDGDPWWQDNFMSQEAKNIERNLGID